MVAPDLRIGLQQLVVGESADLAIEVAVICCGWGGDLLLIGPSKWEWSTNDIHTPGQFSLKVNLDICETDLSSCLELGWTGKGTSLERCSEIGLSQLKEQELAF